MRLTSVTTVEVSADRAWTIIAEEFGDAAVWASSLSSSHLDREALEVGATRIGHVGKRQMSERVTQLDRERRVFAYELTNPPGIMRAATNNWSFTESGPNRCQIESELDLELHWLAAPISPLLKLALKRQMSSAIEEFRHFAETGTPHERKRNKERPT